MTCIVGLVDGGKVYIGGDSAAVAGESIEMRSNRKVFRKGVFVIGFTGSYRVGQLMQYKMGASAPATGGDLMVHMVTKFAKELKKVGGDEIDELLVGHAGRLFKIGADYSIGEYASYTAAGAGAQYALGRLHGGAGGPEDRLRAALEAAQTHCAGVRAPFHIEVA
ncbi:hypothetical protein [Mesorhizobium sp.]|uniref:hypothetical protein n=1 Tax=Mesorhizobium sp. TaxID=1871066 RepID=UPI0012142BD0|nr:hypothetical protein [Mesorhizobium sp.]TIX28883.1 MAG: hypothetical protein E5V35_00545 [Mesorhizobium sp.]